MSIESVAFKTFSRLSSLTSDLPKERATVRTSFCGAEKPRDTGEVSLWVRSLGGDGWDEWDGLKISERWMMWTVRIR